MGRANRGLIRSAGGSRTHHNITLKHSLEFDGLGDTVSWDYNYSDGYPDNSSTAYLWRLKNTKGYNNNTGASGQAAVIAADYPDYGETEMSVAFWVKLNADANNTNSVPVQHGNTNSDTWKSIWKSDSAAEPTKFAGIWIACFSHAECPYPGTSGTGDNYFVMGKGGGASSTAGKAHRVGTTTPVHTWTNGGTYTPQWFHVVCVWHTADQTINGTNGWQMWVNGVAQTNVFDVWNPATRTLELDKDYYKPDSISSQILTTDKQGGGIARRGSNYLGCTMTDFSYWHAALDTNDVAALYNSGVRVGRTAPTQNF